MNARTILRKFKNSRLIGRPLILLYRTYSVARYLLRRSKLAVTWLVHSRETTNFTYDLTERNLSYLEAFVAHVTGRDNESIRGYFDELAGNEDIRAVIRNYSSKAPYSFYTDTEPKFGRRFAWYAIVRALKPKLVVETGVDKGLGALVICAALLRNEAEGIPGKYLGTDINPDAGFLLTDTFLRMGKVITGDSLESLGKLDESIGVFINDSDHSAEYEAREYELIGPYLAAEGVILGDNAFVTDKLYQYSKKYGRKFLYFQEEPANHWHHGVGLGASFV